MATTTLVCKQCNFENEPERVYCHNCGSKLDRSLLPPEATKREDPVLVQERVRRMVKPRNVSLIHTLKNLLSSVLLAAGLATVVVIAKPPVGIPDLSQDAVLEAPPIADDMDSEIQQLIAHRMVYSEDQVNAYLQSSLRGGKAEKAGALAMKFERAYVHLGEGTCQITSAQSLFGFPLYASTERTYAVHNGVLSSKVLGGSLGRLHVPAVAMPVVEAIFQPLKKALDQPLKLLIQMQAVTLHKGSVEMITPARK